MQAGILSQLNIREANVTFVRPGGRGEVVRPEMTLVAGMLLCEAGCYDTIPY